MTPEALRNQVLSVIQGLVADGTLIVEVPATVTIERPRNRDHGDYATNVALTLAKKAGMPPRELAGLVRDRLVGTSGIAAVDIAGPGFLNITLDRAE
jgi:arginyl-tRNA synthetase